MRQAGVLAACGIISLTQMVNRLADDHENTKHLAANIKGIRQLVVSSETNIIFAEIKDEFFDSEKMNAFVVVERLQQKGVLVGSTSACKIRLVVNYHITNKDVMKVSKYIHEIFEG